MVEPYDVALVGGGLQSCLAMLALAAARPGARVAIFEREAELGGNHTWCLHAGDVPEALAAAVAPAIAHRWTGYAVAFPAQARTLASPYACMTSASLAAAVRAAAATRPGFAIHTSTAVAELGARHVTLADGTRIEAARVVDARGPERYAVDACGYQKFVGLELSLAAPHGLTEPVLMDACVPQTDGFRFVYMLPLDPQRVLVEDTYFSDRPELPRAALEAEVLRYASARGFVVERVVREEHGVLPLPLDLPADPGALDDGPLVAGYQGGWFHPTTGYSAPVALRVAAFLAHEMHLADAPVRWQRLVSEHRRQLAFALRLNRMLFRWFAPADRHHVLARFYQLPADAVQRFYALQLTAGDRARILCGRPPRGLSWRAMLTGRSVA